ncbi:MAG: ABC transporter permease [Desulforhopalus sp.]
MKRIPPMLLWTFFCLPLIFLVLFYFYPLTKIILLSFFPDQGWAAAPIDKLFSTSTYIRILWFTTWQAALSTVLTLLFALPGAYVFSRYAFRGKSLLQSLMTVPFVLPTVVTAAAFRALLGSGGLVNTWLMSFFDLSSPVIRIEQTVVFFLLAHVFYNYSLVMRIVGAFWAGMDPNLRHSATLLGASARQTFFKITLPLLMPAIGSAALLVFIFCFTSFGVVLILGGPGYATLEVEIYRQAIQLFNLPMAAALSLVQIAVNFLLMAVHAGLSKKAKVAFYTDTPAEQSIKPATPRQRIFIGTNLLFMALLLLTPLAALVLQSFTSKNGLTFGYYTALFTASSRSVFFVEPISAVYNSIGFALCAMLLAVILGLMASVFLVSGKGHTTSSLWDALIMLPLATSAVTLGFGYIITLNSPPLNLRDSFLLIPIAHCLVAFPFVVRCILPSLRQIPQTLRDAAALLGASPFHVLLRVDIPIVSRAILVGAVFAFSISMGEFGASAFLVRPHTPTMPVAIFRFLGQPGDVNYGQAMAMSTLLMLVTVSGFWLIGKFDTARRIPIPANRQENR